MLIKQCVLNADNHALQAAVEVLFNKGGVVHAYIIIMF